MGGGGGVGKTGRKDGKETDGRRERGERVGQSVGAARFRRGRGINSELSASASSRFPSSCLPTVCP